MNENKDEGVFTQYHNEIIKMSEIIEQMKIFTDFFTAYLIPNECVTYITSKQTNTSIHKLESELFQEIAEKIADYVPFGHFVDRVTGGSEWMYFNENLGIWERNVSVYLEAFHTSILNFFNIKPTDVNLGIMIKQLKLHTLKDLAAIDNNDDIITFMNGTLDLQTWELREHSMNDYSTQLIPHNYIKGSTLSDDKKKWIYNLCSATLNHFPKMTLTDLLDLMLGFLGYVMTKRNNLGKFLILYSKKGGSGKTTWIEVIKQIVGNNLYTEIELDELVEKDFKQAFMVGKLLNTFDDLNGKIIRSEGKLKSMMTARTMTINGKWEKPRNVRKTDKHIYASNELPFIKRIDIAYARRPKILFFENYIPEEEQDINFTDNLVDDEIFLEQLIAESLYQYRSMIERNNSQFGQSQEDMLHMWRMETDIIYQFLYVCCDETPDSALWLAQSELYEFFTTYCEIKGVQTLDQRVFTETLGKLNYPKIQRRDQQKGRIWMYKGLTLKINLINENDTFDLTLMDTMLNPSKTI